MLSPTPLSVRHIYHSRWCEQCVAISPWQTILRRYTTFTAINCLCAGCGVMYGQLVTLAS